MKVVVKRREIVGKLKWFMLFRLILISALLGISPFVLHLGATPFFYIIGLLYLATIVYSLLLKSTLAVRVQAYLQFFVDVAVGTVILGLTGGIESGFVLLYALSIVSASIIIGGHAGLVISVSCSALYALLGIFNYGSWSSFGFSQLFGLASDPVYVGYLIFVRATIFCVLGCLSDYLANNLEKNVLELDKAKKLNEKIVMQMQSGLITADDSGRIIYANKAAEDILGYDSEEMKGEFWHRFFGRSVDDIDDRWISDEAKSFTRCQIEVKRKDGKEVPVGFTVSNLVGDDGEAVGLLILFKDLTQIRRMEERMRRADRISAAGAILTTVAHEVRNPLASIRGAIELIKESGSSGSQSEKLMNIIFKESDHLDSVISNFLLHRGDDKGKRRREDVGRLLKDVLSPVEQGVKSRPGVHIEYRNSEVPVYATVDAGRIKQVFINILDNAIEATPEGGTVTVNLDKDRSASNGKPMARIRFADTGEGMSAERMNHLFEGFYSTKEKGSGIGLFIAEKIVKDHGGQLEAESKEGGGTVFTIALPCEED